MALVTSKDGTQIAFDVTGKGPAVILVAGAMGVRGEPMMAGLAEALSPHFTVYNYNRRGRGDSGDTQPYAVEREIEDIEALIDEAGGSASLVGLSSGAALALEAASRVPGKVTKLAMYEAPYVIDDSQPPVPDDYVERLNVVLAQGRRGDAVEMFMQAVGVPDEFIPAMRSDPSWAEMEAVAHTLPYDFTLMRGTQTGKPIPPERVKQWKAATMPALLIAGENSGEFFHHTAAMLVNTLPNAQCRTLEGQDHAVSGEALAPMLKEFLAG
jgi:pimeloyl-ACP methyl ester carboxylesterase